MQKHAYRNIALLLGSSLLAVLFLQAYWLYYIYRQEQAELNRLAYRALNQVVDKLNEQENLLLIKQRVESDTISFLVPSVNRVIVSTTVERDTAASQKGKSLRKSNHYQYRYVNHARGGNSLSITWKDQVNSETKNRARSNEAAIDAYEESMDKKYADLDSLDAILDAKHAAIDSVEAVFDRMELRMEQVEVASGKSAEVLRKLNQSIYPESDPVDTALLRKKEKDLQALIKKLEREIRRVESDFVKQYDAQQVKELLQNDLLAMGITSPVECAIQQRSADSTHILSSSSGFNATNHFYEADLSRDRLFQKGRFLLMQFSGTRNIIFSRMTRVLLLSLFFTLLMVAVLYASLQLLMKQKKLSDIRNDFVNNMTHELKTPIATISLAADALVKPQVRSADDKFNEYIRILKEENHKLNTHVERVLQMALLEKGELKLNKSRIDLRHLSEACIQSHRLQAQSRHAFIELEAPDAIWYNADPLHLSNALGNLIDNALKYGKENPHIRIVLKKEKDKAIWQVHDNGPGIASSELQKIFDKFYRIQKGALHDVKGFGLGLSYVKSIVDAHGGTISVQSEAGKGTCFTIQFDLTHEGLAG